MKVALITILDNTNFGTYLQALATALAIKKMGNEVEIIHYIRPSMTKRGMSWIIFKERGLLRWLNRVRFIPKILQLRERDFQFLSRYVPVSSLYESFEELKKMPPEADVYLTGSDQVWNSFYNRGVDKSFYLAFLPNEKKRVAYAASIGMDKFSTDEIDEIQNLLKKYDTITVRERAAKELLKSIDIFSDVVLDPTLLMGKDDWITIAKQHVAPVNDSIPYLLIYNVETQTQNKLIKHYAPKIAKRRDLKIYQVSYSTKSGAESYVDKVFYCATPDIFLNLMMRASFVVVSSFHGTAFAINFQKQFLTIAANRFNSRVQNLLEITNLQERMIINDSFDYDNMKYIDYDKVNQVLDRERKRSLMCLQKMIN